jgi:5'-3' exonuclease
MIIYDFSLALNANVHTIDKLGEEVNARNLRIRLLDHLVAVNKKFKDEYGEEIVLALDASSWRSFYFKHYKCRRKSKRKEDKFNWDDIYKIYEQIIEEFKENLPYKIIRIKGCEGDDLIAVLANNSKEKVLIVSRDKDFMQLLDNDNIKQYDPVFDDFIQKDENIKLKLFTHIMKGDDSDDIPCVYSPSDFYTKENRERQKSIKKTEMERLVLFNEEELKEELGEKVFKRFEENRNLIDLSQIPEKIQKKIIDEYENYEISKNNIYKYILQEDLSSEFLKEINHF